MYNFVICVSIYPKAKPFLRDFLTALRDATKKFKVKILFILDNLDIKHENELTENLNSSFFEIIKIREYKTLSEIRNILFKTAIKENSDSILFTDCDDLLEKNALHHHALTLEKYDFSFSNQILINENGEFLKKTLFDNWAVPKVVNNINQLLNGNFIGFSASAVRSNSFSSKDIVIPKNIIASDWWLFSNLVLQGCIGGITSDPVVRYRQHNENLITTKLKTFNLEKVLNLINSLILHFFYLPELPEIQKRYLALLNLKKQIIKDPNMIKKDFENIFNIRNMWYSFLILKALKNFKGKT